MARESDRSVTSSDQPAPPASGARVSHRVRALRRGQPVGRAGGHAARPARARHRPRRDRRDARPGAFNGATIAADAEPPRRRAARGDLGVAPRRGGVPRRAAVTGVEPPHPRRPPLLQPGPARHLPARRHPRHVRGAGRSRCGWWPPTSTPARRSCSRRGPLQPALLASAALPGIYPPIRHDGRTLVDGAVVDTVPLWHALSGPVDRIYVMNVAGDLLRPAAALPDRRRGPGLRHQPQAALRARGAQRARDGRAASSCRPRSTSASCSTSRAARRSWSRPTSSPTPALDDAETAAPTRRQLRRPWWRRDAG